MRVRVLSGVAAAAALLSLQLLTGIAVAADDLVLVSDKVTLANEDGGTATATITILNQAAGPRDDGIDLSVSADPEGAVPGCNINLSGDDKVDWQRQQSFKVTFSAACEPNRAKGTDFVVTGSDGSRFELHANPPATPTPDWRDVAAIYLGSGLAAALVLGLAWASWNAGPSPIRSVKTDDLNLPLPGLEASWKFSDSWAANATVVTTAFSGLFGASEVAEAILGDDSTLVLTVALVVSAVSLGMVGLSPMVLQGLRVQSPGEEALTTDPTPQSNVRTPLTKAMPAGLYATPKGLLIAAFLTLTATIGQLGSIFETVITTDFGTDGVFVFLWIASAAVVLWYAWKATTQNLTAGATLPPPEPPKKNDDDEGEEALGYQLHRTLKAQGHDPGAITAVFVRAPDAAPPRRPAGIL